jgi:hypothetical protein
MFISSYNNFTRSVQGGHPPPRIDLGEVTVHNIKQLKKLNSVVFPVSYNEKFYKDVLTAGELAKLGKLTSASANLFMFFFTSQ